MFTQPALVIVIRFLVLSNVNHTRGCSALFNPLLRGGSDSRGWFAMINIASRGGRTDLALTGKATILTAVTRCGHPTPGAPATDRVENLLEAYS